MVGRVRSPTVPKRIWALTLGWLGMGSANQGAQLITISSVLSSANHDTVWMYSSGIKAVLCCWMLNSIIELDSGYARVRYIYIYVPEDDLFLVRCLFHFFLKWWIGRGDGFRLRKTDSYLGTFGWIDMSTTDQHQLVVIGNATPMHVDHLIPRPFYHVSHLQLYMTPIWEEDLTAA